MGFLDNAGLAHFYGKLKEKFVQSVNGNHPDLSGNVAITNVATADNLTSPDSQEIYDSFVLRTSGGDASISTGEAQLSYIEGKSVAVGRVQEVINTSTTEPGIVISVNAAVFRASTYGATSGTKVFNYAAGSGTWNPTLDGTGITVSGIQSRSITASVGESQGITGAEVNASTWESQITSSGTYTFNYVDGAWKYNDTTITLNTYGITITGSPVSGDSITVNYVKATGNFSINIIYTKEDRGNIYNARPLTFNATSLNTFDLDSMVLVNRGISTGTISSSTNNLAYVRACPARSDTGWLAYSASGAIVAMGFIAGTEVPSTGDVLTYKAPLTLGSDYFPYSEFEARIPVNEDGYVVVEYSGTGSDLCIHPAWSMSENETTYEEYNLSTINIPYTDEDGAAIFANGLCSVGGVKDYMNFDLKIAYSYVEVLNYNTTNLNYAKNSGRAYDYDSNKIYVARAYPIMYTLDSSINPTYQVNDYAIEYFSYASGIYEVGPYTECLYGQNLRDKLRVDVLTISAQELSGTKTESHVPAGKTYYTDTTLETAEGVTDTSYPLTDTNEDDSYVTITISGTDYYVAIADAVLNTNISGQKGQVMVNLGLGSVATLNYVVLSEWDDEEEA